MVYYGEEDEEEKENLTVRELLTEIKDISEVIVDLAYAALLFDSQEIGAEVHHLCSRMDTLNHEIKIRMMIASRTARRHPAQGSCGWRKGATISAAAGDISALELNPKETMSAWSLRKLRKIRLLTLSTGRT